MTRKIIIPAIFLVGILAMGSVGISTVKAQESYSYPPVVQKLAERFNLKEEEVVKVFEDARDEQRANRYADWAENLDLKVANGEISDEQKEAALDKYAELEERIDNLTGLSAEEKHLKLQTIREDLHTWVSENNIDIPILGREYTANYGFRTTNKVSLLN